MEAARNFRQMGRTIIGIGRNYAEHAKELGNAIPTAPILFSKPVSAFLGEGESIKVPHGSSNLHFEVELGVVIGAKLCRANAKSADAAIAGYCLALDMTARDFQVSLFLYHHFTWHKTKFHLFSVYIYRNMRNHLIGILSRIQ